LKNEKKRHSEHSLQQISNIVLSEDDKRWYTYLQEIDSRPERENKLKELLRTRTPPAQVRGLVWQALTGAADLEQKNSGVYEKLLTSSSEFESKIRKDVSRTFPGHAYFQGSIGQESLFNVLKAYAVMDPEIGYCQGMSFIVAQLLLQMTAQKAFWVLVQLFKTQSISGLFNNGLPLLRQYLYILDRLIENHLPKVFSHFKGQGIVPMLFASEWFSTLFTYTFPFETTNRVWDFFFMEGTVYLFRVGLAMLKLSQDIILKSSFETIIEHLKIFGTKVNHALLFKTTNSIRLTQRDYGLLEDEFNHPNATTDIF